MFLKAWLRFGVCIFVHHVSRFPYSSLCLTSAPTRCLVFSLLFFFRLGSASDDETCCTTVSPFFISDSVFHGGGGGEGGSHIFRRIFPACSRWRMIFVEEGGILRTYVSRWGRCRFWMFWFDCVINAIPVPLRYRGGNLFSIQYYALHYVFLFSLGASSPFILE